MNSPFYLPCELNIRTSDDIGATQGQRCGNAEALELAAWRYLAAHRVGSLHATHTQFVDGDGECRINTPSTGQFYESVGGPTFGHAAIKLALTLGMQWPSRCLAARSVLEQDSSSAPTAIHPSGESSQTSPGTPAAPVGSTTGATSAEAPTDAEDGHQPKTGESS